MTVLSLRSGQNWALVAMVAASALIGATTLIGKLLGAEGDIPLHPLQISAGRFGFAMLTLIAVVVCLPRLRPSFERVPWALHVQRSACGWLGVTCLFAAVANMPLAEATALSFLSPIVTICLSVLLLGERLTWRIVLALLLAVAGGFVLLNPGAEAVQAAGLYALAAAALFGVEMLFIKRLSGREPPIRILIVNNAIGAAISVLAAMAVWQMPSPQAWLLLALLGAVMVSGQAMFIQAVKNGAVGVIMPLFYSTLLFAALYDAVIFQTQHGLALWLGAGLIIAAALTVSLPAWRG